MTRFGSFFLADPEAFPDAVEGQPWGDQRRLLDLPGGPFSITGLSAVQGKLMDREYSSVMAIKETANAEPDQTQLFRVEPGFFRDFDIEGWDYTLDLDSAPDRLQIATLHFAALVPWTGGARSGLWTSVEDRWFQGVIENYLRVVVAYRLLLRDGMLLHSSGAVIDGSAYLFVGASGAGKSTLAHKALGADSAVLSDDLNAVVDISVEPAVAQLPFTGDLRKQSIFEGTAPLRGLFLLEQGSAVACEALTRGEAAAALIATAPYINQAPENLDGLVAAATRLTARIPIARLTSAVDSPFEEIKRAVQRFLR